MSAATADLAQQSRVAEGAALYLRSMSCGPLVPDDLRAVAAALEKSGLKLRRLALVIENTQEVSSALLV